MPCPQGRARAFTDADPSCTVLAIDGVGAYDHVFRSSFLAKLHSVPSLQGLLPFVRSVYARPTTYVWEDGTGARIGSPEFVRAVDERLRPEGQTVCAPLSPRDLRMKADCGTQSLRFLICSARGRSSCSVLDPGAIICCALCLQASLQSTPSVTTTA